MNILKLGDKQLRCVSEEITNFDSDLKFLEAKMYETLDNAEGIGLAAPQVGKLVRMFIVSIPSKDIRRTFVNPFITDFSKETSPYCEGCLSIPGLEHDVIRPEKVTVYAQDTDGKPFHITVDGLYARVIQHENDHLNGKLFIDHLEEDEKKKIISKFKRNSKNSSHKRKR